MLSVKELYMDYEKNPVGIDHVPQFGWIIEGSGRGIVQSGCQLQIASDKEFTGILYDSGMTDSGESAHFHVEGFSLASATKYYVRVRVRAGEEVSDYCEPGFFVTGILRPEEWKAAFISAETEEDADNSKGTCLGRTFSLKTDTPIREAFAFTTALGLYNFYLNGKKVGKDELTPGWTTYKKRVLYQTYEVTEYLRAGENETSAMLGAGWYKGLMGICKRRNNYGKQTAFLMQMVVRYEDGSSQLVISDPSWRGADSPIVFSEIYDGEIRDDRLMKDDRVYGAAFADGSRPVETVAYPMNALEAQGNCRVQEIEEVPVKQVITTPKGETVLDFGQNMTGRIHVRTHGKPGETVELRCFEVLDAQGNAYFDNLRRAKETFRYTFGKQENVDVYPYFTFMGFQYAQVVSWPEGSEPSPETVTAYTLHSRMEPTLDFTCSRKDLEQLNHNILWGMKGNFVDVPTDCPQRDERLGWTGDAQIFCRTADYLMNTFAFYRKWLKDVVLDQTEEGGIPHVVPDLLTGQSSENWLVKECPHSASAWADVITIMPWNLYLNFGDKDVLAENYDAMKAWVGFMERNSKDYIWNYKVQFGDWVALDAEEGSYFGATPNDLTCTAFFAYSTELTGKIAKILGREEDAAYYEALYEKIKEAFQKQFFREDGTMTAQTQTAHIIALYFKLAPEKYVDKTVEGLLRLLEKENGHLVTGFVGTPYFCHALSRYGCLKEAYELLLKDDFPSWLYQVKMGATTIWEHWDGKKPDGTMWSAGMNSFNHYAYGAVGEWIYRVAVGLDTDEADPGFHHARIAPHPGGGIESMGASYKTVYGKIAAKWTVKDDVVSLDITIPANTTADILLYQAEELLETDGLSFEKDGENQKAAAGSGTYHLAYRSASVL